MLPTDLTVLAVVENDGNFLMIEERVSGRRVLTQPGGHIEAGESPEDALVREVQEESGCHIAVANLLGVYLWIHPQTRQQFLKIAYIGDLLSQKNTAQLEESVFGVHWLSAAEIRGRTRNLRNPVVLRCIDDFQAGCRQSSTLLEGMLPLQHNVHAVLASASLV